MNHLQLEERRKSVEQELNQQHQLVMQGLVLF